MQHGIILTVNLWLILLVNHGQTDDICGAGKIRRGDKCCLSRLCEDTGFAECTVNNTKDICNPCSEGFYLIGQYETSNFPDPNVCAPIKKCSPEEVKNEDGECVCDVARGYYRIDEGICGLVQISCTPAGRQLSLNGHCDPCPVGYFKPVASKQRCRKKSNITCSSTQIILEGNTTTDRKCVKSDVIASTSTYSPPLSTYINITNDVIDRNGNDALLKWVIGVLVFVIVLSVVVVVILLVRRHRRLRQRQQLQDLENHGNDEHVPLQPVNGALPIVDDDNFDNGEIPYQTPQDNIPNVTGRPGILAPRYQLPQDNIPNVTGGPRVIVPRYQSPQDNIPNDDDNVDNEVVPYQSPQDNIPNDDDNFDNGAIPYQSPQDNIPNVTGRPGILAPRYQPPQDNVPNVTGGPRVIDNNIDDESHSCGAEVVTRDNSQTYVKVPYASQGSSINNAVIGDMPSDEDNSNKDDGSFNPLSGDDRLCQGAVGGDIDDNDTASSINNENPFQDVKLLNHQPSSEHNLQQGRMVSGPRSFPVQNPAVNLPLPHYHDGSSDEDDSGFQN